MSDKPGKTKPQQYPRRQAYFANRVIRLMTKTAAAQVIGPEGVWLVTVIVMTEDVNRYSGPVTYFNGQLCPLLGIATWRTLDKVRAAAIEAGWLQYEGDPRGHLPGKYFVTIPKALEAIEDSSTSEDPKHGQDPVWICNPDIPNGIPGDASGDTSPGTSGDRSGCPPGSRSPSTSGDASGSTSFLPNPKPNTNTPLSPPQGGSAGAGKSSGKKSGKPRNPPPNATEQARIQQLWEAYPLKSHKGRGLDAILKALRSGADFRVMFEAVRAFAAAVNRPPLVDWGRVPHAASWFNAKRWEDDRKAWPSVGRMGPEYEARAAKFNPGQVTGGKSHERGGNGNSGGGRKSYEIPPETSSGGDGSGDRKDSGQDPEQPRRND